MLSSSGEVTKASNDSEYKLMKYINNRGHLMINCILIAAALVVNNHYLSSLLMPRPFLSKLHEVFGYILFIP